MRRIAVLTASLLLIGGAASAQVAERPSTFIASPWSWTGVQTIGDGNLVLSGSSSGSSTLHAPASAGGAVTFFAGADTVAGKSLANAGTNAALTASNGGIVYSSASALGILSGTATANQVVLSGSSTTPAWSTATYPATTTINQLLYSSAANTIAGLATANSSILVTSAGGVPSLSTTLPAGVAISKSVSTGITAGASQGTTVLASQIDVIGTCASSNGVTLPAAVAGVTTVVVNHGANTCNVWPPSGDTINSLSANSPLSLPVDTSGEFVATTASAFVSIP